MKKVLVSAIAVLMIAGAANATLIGLQWQATPTQESLATAPNGTATAQFYIQSGAPNFGTQTLTGIGIVINAYADAALTIPVANEVFQVSVTPLIPGWSLAAANNNSAMNGLQFAAMNGGNYVPPAAKTALMNIDITYTNAAPPARYYLTINTSASSIFDETGGEQMVTGNLSEWDARAGYADSYAAYWAFGNWGNPGWSRNVGTKTNPIEAGQPGANPLILLTPEPASLALLALGGFAALRRR